jgi:hypothetical protein
MYTEFLYIKRQTDVVYPVELKRILHDLNDDNGALVLVNMSKPTNRCNVPGYIEKALIRSS